MQGVTGQGELGVQAEIDKAVKVLKMFLEFDRAKDLFCHPWASYCLQTLNASNKTTDTPLFYSSVGIQLFFANNA